MLEEATDKVYIPVIGEVQIDGFTGLAVLVIGLLAGSTLWNMTDDIGGNLAARINNFIGQFLPGGNPASSSDNSGPVGV